MQCAAAKVDGNLARSTQGYHSVDMPNFGEFRQKEQIDDHLSQFFELNQDSRYVCNQMFVLVQISFTFK